MTLMVPRKGVLVVVVGGDPVWTWWTSLCRAVEIFSSRSGSARLLLAFAAAVRVDEGWWCFGAARARLGDALPIAAEYRGSCRDRLVGGSATWSGLLAGRLMMPSDSAGSSGVVVPGAAAEAVVAIASLSLRRCSLSLMELVAALSAFST
jgi:hypothetical protein